MAALERQIEAIETVLEGLKYVTNKNANAIRYMGELQRKLASLKAKKYYRYSIN